MKNKNYIVLLLFLSFVKPMFAQSIISELYVDRAIVIERLKDSIERINDGKKDWSARGLRSRSSTVQEDTKITASLPKSNKQRLKGEKMYKQCLPGVLMVCRYFDCGECDTMHTSVNASAVALTADGICATNYHVVKTFLNLDTVNSRVDSIYFLASPDGKVFPIVEVLSYSILADLAIVKVDTRGEKLTPIPLDNDERMLPGEAVRTITHPTGLLYAYSEGVVSNNVETKSKGPASRRMNITADYAVGSSGGPIFDEAGNLVAIVSSTRSIKADATTHQMTVKMTIPVSSIRNLFN